MKGQWKRDVCWYAGIAACVVAVAVVRLMSDASMWHDEAMSAAVVDRSFFDMLHVVLTREAGMGPYHVVLWFWSRAGDSDEWLRGLSVVGGVATALALFHLMARWFDRGIAALAVGLLVANPAFLTHLTEARRTRG